MYLSRRVRIRQVGGCLAILAVAPQPTGAGSLGPNGVQIDPLIVSVTSTSGGFAAAPVPEQQFRNLCSDDDGCEVRLISVAGGDRLISGVTSVVLDSASGVWHSAVGPTVFRGVNGNSVQEAMAANVAATGPRGDCLLGDDGKVPPISQTSDWVLIAYHFFAGEQGPTLECVLRIDD